MFAWLVVCSPLTLQSLNLPQGGGVPPFLMARAPFRAGHFLLRLRGGEESSSSPGESSASGGSISRRVDEVGCASMALTKLRAAALCDSGGKLCAARLNLTSLDAGVGDVMTVRRADVSNNQLVDFGGLRRNDALSWLHAQNNCIASGRAVAGMVSLRVLNLGHNRLEILEGIGGCRQLQALMANDNAISSLEGLPPLARLASLVLSGNRISSVPPDLFSSFPLLSKLSLSRNRLSFLPSFPESAPLRELRLAYNALEALPTLPPSITILDLGHNRLNSLRSLEPLRQLPRLTNLNLAGNPLASSSSYRSAVLALCPALKTFDGRPVQTNNGDTAPRVKKADPREIFVSNLPWGATEGHIRRLCSDLGPRSVIRIQLLKQASRGGRSKGAAFVKLRTAELAEEACATLGNRTLAAASADGSTMVRGIHVRASWRDVHGKPIPSEHGFEGEDENMETAGDTEPEDQPGDLGTDHKDSSSQEVGALGENAPEDAAWKEVRSFDSKFAENSDVLSVEASWSGVESSKESDRETHDSRVQDAPRRFDEHEGEHPHFRVEDGPDEVTPARKKSRKALHRGKKLETHKRRRAKDMLDRDDGNVNLLRRRANRNLLSSGNL